MIQLITGAAEDKHDIWAYALIPVTKYLEFKHAELQGDYDLSDFGEIIYSGEGKYPPQDIVAEVKEKYGADNGFEENFKDRYEEFIKELIEENIE